MKFLLYLSLLPAALTTRAQDSLFFQALPDTSHFALREDLAKIHPDSLPQLGKALTDSIDVVDLTANDLNKTKLVGEKYQQEQKISEVREQVQRYSNPITLSNEQLPILDSATVAQHLNGLPQPDSTAFAQATQQAEKKAEEAFLKETALNESAQPIDPKQQMKEALAGYNGYSPDKLQSRQEVYQQVTEAIEKLGEDPQTLLADRWKAAQKQLSKDKKKYTDLPSLEAKDHLPKNRLNGQPMRERITWGGLFQWVPANEPRLQVSPEVSYQLYPRWLVGVGLNYQLHLKREKEVPSVVGDDTGLGWRAFSQYRLYKGFSLHGEYSGFVKTESRQPDHALLGLARRFSVAGRVSGQVQLLYNFLYDPFMPSSRRWTYRLGFQLGGKRKNGNRK
ncbi:MAG: hypothetical protein AAGA66_07815 [Bacteroidota bacterium]